MISARKKDKDMAMMILSRVFLLRLKAIVKTYQGCGTEGVEELELISDSCAGQGKTKEWRTAAEEITRDEKQQLTRTRFVCKLHRMPSRSSSA